MVLDRERTRDGRFQSRQQRLMEAAERKRQMEEEQK